MIVVYYNRPGPFLVLLARDRVEYFYIGWDIDWSTSSCHVTCEDFGTVLALKPSNGSAEPEAFMEVNIKNDGYPSKLRG